MEVSELIEQVDADLKRATKECDELVSEAQAAVGAAQSAQERVTKLTEQRETLRNLAGQYGVGGEHDGVSEEDIGNSDWTGLPRLDAVERVLREAGQPIHLRKIEQVLAAHGREDQPAVVSAALAHLKSKRKSAISVSRGVWQYNAIGQTPKVIDQMAQETRNRLGHRMDLPPALAPMMDSGPHPENMPEGWQRGDETHTTY